MDLTSIYRSDAADLQLVDEIDAGREASDQDPWSVLWAG